jgi:hypothetical protein
MSAIVFSLVNNLQLWGLLLFAALFVGSVFARSRKPLVESSPASGVKRFVIGLVVSTALIAGTNYIVNPFGTYPPHVFEPLGEVSRALKLELIDEHAIPPQCVVLGSSRSMGIQPTYIQQITGLPTFNAGVNAAIPRDYLAIMRYLEQKHELPKVLLVGLGLEQLVGIDIGPKLENPDPLDKYVVWDSSPPPSLLSIEQTQATFTLLAKIAAGTYVSDRVLENRKLFLADGGHTINASPDAVEALVTALLDTKPGFSDDLSDGQFAHLKALLELCKKYNIRLIIYLPPYHPRLLAYYEQQTAYLRAKQAILDRLGALQEVYPFILHDFTDVRAFSGDSTDMADAFHPSDKGAQKIIATILHLDYLEPDRNVF